MPTTFYVKEAERDRERMITAAIKDEVGVALPVDVVVIAYTDTLNMS